MPIAMKKLRDMPSSTDTPDSEYSQQRIHSGSDGTEGREGENDSEIRASSALRLDCTDLKLMDSLMLGRSSRESARILNKPVSTIQRRARLLVQHGILKPRYELMHSKLGLKKGFLHIYLDDGNISEMVDKLLTRDGIYSASAHIGNSDVIGMFVYNDSHDIIALIAWAKHQQGVERIVWSEEVYAKSTSPKIEKIIKRNGNGKAARLMTN